MAKVLAISRQKKYSEIVFGFYNDKSTNVCFGEWKKSGIDLYSVAQPVTHLQLKWNDRACILWLLNGVRIAFAAVHVFFVMSMNCAKRKVVNR